MPYGVDRMGQMHDDELPTGAELARRLLVAQFPEWSTLQLRPVTSTGTSNAMYRLGDDMVMRLPLRPGSEASLRKEMRWLPELASSLPLTIPVPIALGEATAEYPSAWAVVPWLDGVDGTNWPASDSPEVARDLADFVAGLHRHSVADDAPAPSLDPSDRGGPLAPRDAEVRSSVEAARHLTNADAVLRVWQEALAAPAWDLPGVWIHGDIAAGNVLFADDRLSAIIDWSPMAVGDPASDLVVVWEMFGPEAREAYRFELNERAPYELDDAMWQRGRGWAISTAIMALPYYEGTNAFMVDQAHRKIGALIDES